MFSSICGKKVTAVFDDHRVTSDAGVLLLREVEQRIKLIDALTDAIVDSRHSSYVRHEVWEMLAQRVFQIAVGYEDANDCDTLRGDPAFKIAAERHPVDDPDLASQPTISRLEKTVFAAIRALEIIGEAAKHVPQKVRRKYPEVPWREMAGMRDKVIHE